MTSRLTKELLTSLHINVGRSIFCCCYTSSSSSVLAQNIIGLVLKKKPGSCVHSSQIF